MKYSEKNKPLVCMQTQSTCYKGTQTMKVLGVLWHSTGANNPNLRRYVQPSDNASDRKEMLTLLGTNTYKNDWNHINHQAGLNCWIGKLADGTVTTVQTMPWNYKPWGCGSGSRGSCNNGWIQFEICEDGLTDKTYFDKVYREACEITAYLCKMFGIDPNGSVDFKGVKVPTILCHADSYKLGLGSNHGDVLHWFPKFGKSMATVRADVAALLKADAVTEPSAAEDNREETQPPAECLTSGSYRVRLSWTDSKSQVGAYRILANAKKTADAHPGYGVFDPSGALIYPIVDTAPKELVQEKTAVPETPAMKVPFLVRISISDLNIRTGPGTYYTKTGKCPGKGVYTIVAVESGQGSGTGWGKLKSGAGWIALDFCTRL